MKKTGKCWLCGHIKELTEEHIPPEAAYNDAPVLLQEVSRRTALVGRLEWEGHVDTGLKIVSLCGECNSKCGSKYGGDFVRFIRKVAAQVEAVPNGHQMLVSGIERPLSIVKAVTQSFVSANGPAFVDKNEWVRKFLRNSRNVDWPRDVFLYLFATNSGGGRKSGVAAFYRTTTRTTSVVAEFTFWPLGSVLSFSELRDSVLSPIHHWAKFEYKYDGKIDLALTVNPVATAYPVDFRDRDVVEKDAAERHEPLAIGSETTEGIAQAVKQKAGEGGNWMFVAKHRPELLP
jgi:hypothetical protein